MLFLISGSKLSELGLCTRYCFNSFLSQAPQFKGFPKRKNSLNTIGCSAWEASLSNILWSGGCNEWSSSARAALHRCRSRAWSPASHMTCWFLSVCTRDCRILATASWRSSACSGCVADPTEARRSSIASIAPGWIMTASELCMDVGPVWSFTSAMFF